MKEILIKCLKEAGEVQLGYFETNVGSKVKESQSSIVTKADLESEKVIIELIKTHHPDHNIISEEYGLIDNQSAFTWVIDPLDGTSNYAANIPWFGVLIAIMENHQPIMAGAYLPGQNLLYFAEKGKGATCNDQLIMVTKKGIKECLFAFSTDFTEDMEYLDYGINLYKYIILNSRNVRTTNSLLDLVYVADGKLGGDINLFTKIWDIAAPSLIIEEAGGMIKDLFGQDLKFVLNEQSIHKNYPIIATTQANYLKFENLLKK